MCFVAELSPWCLVVQCVCLCVLVSRVCGLQRGTRPPVIGSQAKRDLTDGFD